MQFLRDRVNFANMTMIPNTLQKTHSSFKGKIITWPSMFTDLNPAEHFGSILKQKVEQHTSTSKYQLKRIISEEWQNICYLCTTGIQAQEDVIKTKADIHNLAKNKGIESHESYRMKSVLTFVVVK